MLLLTVVVRTLQGVTLIVKPAIIIVTIRKPAQPKLPLRNTVMSLLEKGAVDTLKAHVLLEGKVGWQLREAVGVQRGKLHRVYVTN
jgi:hypothetical protein